MQFKTMEAEKGLMLSGRVQILFSLHEKMSGECHAIGKNSTHSDQMFNCVS